MESLFWTLVWLAFLLPLIVALAMLMGKALADDIREEVNGTMMTKDDWDAYKPVTQHLAVARWGKVWYVVDRETNMQIGYPCDTRTEAREQAEMRQSTTYGGA